MLRRFHQSHPRRTIAIPSIKLDRQWHEHYANAGRPYINYVKCKKMRLRSGYSLILHKRGLSIYNAAVCFIIGAHMQTYTFLESSYTQLSTCVVFSKI